MTPDANAADDPAKRLALKYVVARIEAAEPSDVVAERLELDATGLVVGDEQYDLDAYSDVIVVGIVTGGESELMPAPADGIDLSDLRTTTEGLLASGATIQEINAVHKHCSNLKEGQLAAAASPATVVGLVFSDVVGNRLDVIASGPLTPDESTYADALAILESYAIDVPDTVETRLRRGSDGVYPETPCPADDVFALVS